MIQKNKTTLLIITLIIILILILVAQVLLPRKGENILPSASPTTQNEKNNEFKIISMPTTQLIRVTDSVKIIFNKPVNSESITLEILPQVNILPLFDSTLTELTIEPAQIWDFDKTYIIRVLKSTKSKDNIPLDKDYEFTFTTKSYSGT